MTPEIEAKIIGFLPRVRVPGPNDRVYKDECVFTFDTPESEDGLFICLNSFWAFGREMVESYHSRTGNSVFLHHKRIKTKIEKPSDASEPPEKKITKLAIGIEGGFDVGGQVEYDIQNNYQVVVLPGFHEVPISEQLPPQLLASIEGVKNAESALRLAELEALAGTWDGEVRKVSKHADQLVQFENGKRIPPKGWKCEVPGCNLTENLWLNLTDGSILCGRRYFDGTGGNNHAIQHYDKSKYPLAVKLGTITPDGRGDVYSYDEDDMVEDPKLVQHLAHFGINVTVLEKTDKSMLEMEIELNQRQGEWNAIQESGSKLKPLFGPGYTGLVNLGNSCYLNSIMQVMFTIPEFQNRFSDPRCFELTTDPVNDFIVQMTKMCMGLNSGKYSVNKNPEAEDPLQPGINPIMFRTLIGKGHQEFSTKRQQDAQEFYLHLLAILERNCRNNNPAECFKFQVEDKIVCDTTAMVRYAHRLESCLPLPIPIDAATNKTEVLEYETKKREMEASGAGRVSTLDLVRPKIPFDACVAAFIASETLNPFYSTGTGSITTASKFTRLSTFPDYLVIQLKKFTMGEDWTPKKLDVSVDMPFDLDITSLRGQGLQPNEVPLPEGDKKEPAPVACDESVVNQLTDMGFHPNAAKKAVILTGNTGSEAATEWIMQHLDDGDINEPYLAPGSGSQTNAPSFVANEEALQQISMMGFTPEQGIIALKATDNNIERAIDWIFSHQDELNDPIAMAMGGEVNPPTSEPAMPNVSDGPGKYKLLGFVSHMGTSTMVGHYVCHILKNGQWTIFNDNKVAESENLPKDLGYLYFYKRSV